MVRTDSKEDLHALSSGLSTAELDRLNRIRSNRLMMEQVCMRPASSQMARECDSNGGKQHSHVAMQELGLKEAVDDLSKHNIPSEPKKLRKKRQERDSDDWEPPAIERRSSRDVKRVTSYREDDYYGEALPRLYGGGGPRGPREVREVDEAGLALLREKHGSQHLPSGGGDRDESKGKKKRGPQDSGKGVRIQGGRVYDSTFGVTCHWCRQKTLEDKVTCTAPGCGKGKRLPTTFCKMCLRNRHGEDFAQAAESSKWVCPLCRVSCGPGCVCCCNCGPCRKKAGLDPTHQLVKSAQQAGFNNAHDYLIHLVTKEDPEEIAGRKLAHSWGAWLKDDSEGEEGAGEEIPEEEEEPQPKRVRGRRGEKASLVKPRVKAGKEEEVDLEVQTPDAIKPKSLRGRKAVDASPSSPMAAKLNSVADDNEEAKEVLAVAAKPLSRKERAKAKLGL